MHQHHRQNTSTIGLSEGYEALFADPHRFSFNGKESDSEVKGEGNQQDYGMRVYDNRLGRFLSVDPLYSDYPMLTSYQFASNKPIRYIDIDGNEAGNPMWYIAEGFRQYFDAGLNTFCFDFNFSLFFSDNQKSIKVGSTTVTSGRTTTNSTTASYSGWNWYKPAAWPVGPVSVSDAPAPKVEVKNTTTQSTVTTIKKQVTPNTTYQRKVENSNGQTTTTTTVSGTVTTNTGLPITGSVSNSTSSDGTKTVTYNGQVGTSNANIFIQKTTTTTNGSNSTTSTTAGVELGAETPIVSGQSAGVNLKVQAGVQTPK
jgi:RHS repeat-associated protein